MSVLNITSMLRRGRELDRIAHRESEIPKEGTLRAGNSGIMSREGDVAAACVRKSLLRQLGLEIDPPNDSKQIMFQLGYASEDLCVSDLTPTLPEGHTLLREADIPIDWTLSNGTRVTGRPDLVVVAEDKPILGIELKSVHSVWTAKEVLFNSTPKLANIAQAAHYMWKLGIPYKLIYKSYSHLGQGMSWSDKMAAMFPKQGDRYSAFMEYNERGKPKQVVQFEIVYDLEIDSRGRVKYRLESADEYSSSSPPRASGGAPHPPGPWEYSLVTVGDIERYYEFVSTMQSEKKLGPRPMTLDAVGNKLSYSDCGYCPMQSTCDKFESKGFDTWLAEVRKQDALNKKEIVK